MLAWERTAPGAESPEVIERVDAVVGFVLPFAALLILSVVPVLAVL
jgi:hypothetical protein